MEDLNNKTMLGFPVWIYIIMTVLILYLAANDILLDNMAGALIFAVVVGTFAGKLGDHIPIWDTWMGGGMLFTSLFAATLNTYNLVGESTKNVLVTFNHETGFLDLYILVLITGSVLAVNRKLLLKSFTGYLPTILGGVVCALSMAALVGSITGIGAANACMNFAIPVMGGGNGAGIQPMSRMWAAATGRNASEWFAPAFATISLGNLFAVIFSALLNKLGMLYPSLTGNGQLIRLAKGETMQEDMAVFIRPKAKDYIGGLILSIFCYMVADYYAKHLSLINNKLNLGFNIHTFAFMVVLVACLNLSNFIPQNIRVGAKGLQNFFVRYLSFPLMITVGIGTSLRDYANVLADTTNIFIIFVTVLGALLGSCLVGNCFDFYPIEGMLTAGLCMANGGGAGDVQCLGAANRMGLMSYAQISSRIGGAIMLIIASCFFGKYLG